MVRMLRCVLPHIVVFCGLSGRKTAVGSEDLSRATPPPPAQYPLFIVPELALIPNETIPQFIFEPRYRHLVTRCLESATWGLGV